MHINGFFLVVRDFEFLSILQNRGDLESWTDPRLRWDTAEWKMKNMTIKSFGHLWMPDIYSDR